MIVLLKNLLASTSNYNKNTIAKPLAITPNEKAQNNQDEPGGYLKPKRYFMKPFFRNGIQQVDLGKF
jgi:hypothetical protein